MKTCCLLLVLLLVSCQEYEELYSAFAGKTAADLAGWTVFQAESQKQTDWVHKCGAQEIFGGPKAFGKGAVPARSFEFPPHYQVKINVQLWKIGTWKNQQMNIYADDMTYETLWGDISASDKTVQKCASDPNLFFYDIEYTFSHTHATMALFFVTTIDKPAATQSFGIRNLKVSFKQCPKECGVCFGADPMLCQMWEKIGVSLFKLDAADIEGWTVTKGKAEVTECAGVKMFGGLNKFATKTEIARVIQKLVPHYRIKVMFQFWKIDDWKSDTAELHLDRTLKWSQVVGFGEKYQLCPKADVGGVDLPEKLINVNFETPHEFDAVSIKLTTSLQQAGNKSSWGVRQFAAYVAKCAKNCAACSGPGLEDCRACASPYILSEEEGKGCVLTGDWVEFEKDMVGDAWAAPHADWKVNGKPAADSVSLCGELKMLGGYEKFGKGAELTRKYKLPAHKRVRISFEAWKIDEWKGESYIMKANGVEIYRKQFGFGDAGFQDVCGGEGFENMINADIIIGHEAEILDLWVGSDIDTNKEATWAIKNVIVSYEKPDKCATLYTGCNFTGKSFNLCEDNANFQLSKYPSKIKSIQVPLDTTIVLYDEESYKGYSLEYTKNVECIESYDYKFLDMSRPRVVLTANTN